MKNYTLPKEFAQKWVSALRSGEYEQAQQALKNDIGYCCLGVACMVVGVNDDDLFGVAYPANLKSKLIPDTLKRDATPDTLVGKVGRLNDVDGKSFTEIADWIQANVEFV